MNDFGKGYPELLPSMSAIELIVTAAAPIPFVTTSQLLVIAVLFRLAEPMEPMEVEPIDVGA